MQKVITYLDENGFFTAPSSVHRHHNWRGGLAQHSLGVYKEAVRRGEELPNDSLIICALLHDICKARQFYVDRRGKIRERGLHIKGHGWRSVWLLKDCGLLLTEDERRAIRWHMSGFSKRGRDEDLDQALMSPLWKTIHTADKRDAGRGSYLH